MPLRKLFLQFLFLYISFNIKAQHVGFPSGARSAGLGAAAVTLGDPYSLFNNIGGLAETKNLGLILANENKSGIEGLGTVAAGVILPIKIATAGIAASRFGDDLYNQQVLSAGLSHKIGIVSLGVKANYIQYNLEGFGRRTILAVDFGGVATLTPHLVFGAHAFNINQAKVNHHTNEYLPTILKAGLSYRPTKQLMLNVETEKDVDFPAQFKAGLEYEIVKTLFLRTGINTAPFSSFYGLGINPGWFLLDYSYGSHSFLGYSHQFSLSFNLVKN